MSWDTEHDAYSSLIEKKLEGYFSSLISSAGNYHPFVRDLYTFLSDYILRKGKRIASFSTLVVYKGYTGSLDAQILSVCMGIEFYRHHILIHDDLVDRDPMRRGGKALHRGFSTLHGRRFGDGVAIFAGNILHSLALQGMMSSSFPLERLHRALSALNEAQQEVNESQALDLLFEYASPDVREWSAMASKRAASLFRASMLIGALLGNAPEGDLRTLKEAASHIGYSFDIQDDIIDTFATPEQYGREPGRDLIFGKKALHVILLRELAPQREAKLLERMVVKRRVAKKELEAIKSAMREEGALEAAKKESRRRSELAKSLIYKTSMTDEAKAILTSLITFIDESLDWYK